MRHIINADAIKGLKQLPDSIADMCVTSPPYFGLRDYGTAEWEGGDPECNHLQQAGQRNDVTRAQKNGFHSSSVLSELKVKPYVDLCKKCGAVRIDKQIGLEHTPQQYIEKLVNVFSEVKRILKDDGTLWINIGDSYNGSGGAGGDYSDNGIKSGQPKYPGRKIEGIKPKDLIGIPWILAFALRADGWYLRQDIIWHKPNPMPESVTDRCTKSHEYIFLLSKSAKYYFNNDAIKEPCSEANIKDYLNRNNLDNKGVGIGTYKEVRPDLCRGREAYMPHDFRRNKRDVWKVNTQPYRNAHFATFPPDLIRPCILAGSRPTGIVLDPFLGSGTTAVVAIEEGRDWIGIELNPAYIAMADDRIKRTRKLPIQEELSLCWT